MENFLYYVWQMLAYKYLKIMITSFVSLLSWLIWGFDIPVQALFVFVTIDYLLWFSYAWKTNSIKGKKMKEWIYKYILFTVAIIMWNMLDLSIFKTTPDFGWHSLIIIYLCINESISISKPLSNFCVKLPAKLIQKLESYRDELDLPERRITRIEDVINNSK